MKVFNVAGPCLPDRHYMLPAEPRLPQARELVDQGSYFVVHAPRQTGKTTSIASLANALLAEGRYVALRLSCEAASAAGDDYPAAQRMVLDSLRLAAQDAGLPADLAPPDPWPDGGGLALRAGLRAWAERCPKPLVLFFDEIDSLAGPSLVSVLRQLRDGYTTRPGPFPHSVMLCGMRDVRDYKLASGGDPERLTGPSPFNVKITSIRMGDFSAEQVRELYAQHTEETGQPFTDAAVQTAFDYTQGQPWLVNALAYEIIRNMRVDPAEPITPGHMEQARERLIQARATHLDSLVARLYEDRVRRVIEPVIAGTLPDLDETFNDDLGYVRDLGLVKQGWPVTVANPIYREVIARVLGDQVNAAILADPRSFVRPDGRLDFSRLLEEFADFWRQHGSILIRKEKYHEAAAQLVLMGFLHRIVNGGGQVDREYAIGSGRIDLAVRWPYRDADGRPAVQREAMELKVWRPRQRDPLPEGLRQLDDYLDRLRLDHGTLIIFDRRREESDVDTEFSEQRTPSGRTVTLLRA